MCGIFASSFTPNYIDQIISDLARRGPDSSRLVLFENAVTKCWCLQTTLAVETVGSDVIQPLCIENVGCFMFNGEIYNYRALSDYYNVKAQSDTELIEKVLEYTCITDFIPRIIGPFSCILIANEGHMFFFRDFLGEKPLFYSETNQGIMVSSSESAMLFETSGEIDQTGCKQFIKSGFSASGSIFKDIHSCEPGVLYKYDLQNKSFNTKIIEPNMEEHDKWFEKNTYKTKILHINKNVIPTKVKYALLYSGGADSSYLLRTMSPDQKVTLITLEENTSLSPLYDDHILLKPNYSEEFIKEYVENLSSPLGDPAGVGFYQMAIVAKERNIKVLISGDGVDELIESYPKNILLKRFFPKSIHRLILLLYYFGFFIPISRLSISENLDYAARFDAGFRLPNYLLPRGDLSTMGAGVELRSPFLVWPNFLRFSLYSVKNVLMIKRFMKSKNEYFKYGFPANLKKLNDSMNKLTENDKHTFLYTTNELEKFRRNLLILWLETHHKSSRKLME